MSKYEIHQSGKGYEHTLAWAGEIPPANLVNKWLIPGTRFWNTVPMTNGELQEINSIFVHLGFKEDAEYKGIWSHSDLPFTASEHGGYLRLCVNMEYHIDGGVIPFTEQNLINILTAFNPPI